MDIEKLESEILEASRFWQGQAQNAGGRETVQSYRNGIVYGLGIALGKIQAAKNVRPTDNNKPL